MPVRNYCYILDCKSNIIVFDIIGIAQRVHHNLELCSEN